MLPTVAQQVGTAQADGNVTGAADTLVGLTTLFFALAIATSAIGEKNAHKESNFFMLNPEYRLTSLRGQDRSENRIALTTDKGFLNGRIYSLVSYYKMKYELTQMIAAQGGFKIKPYQREISDKISEYRLTSLRGQDRSENHKNFARETDKDYFTFSLEDESKIYSPNSNYKKKLESNKIVEKFRFNLINLN